MKGITFTVSDEELKLLDEILIKSVSYNSRSELLRAGIRRFLLNHIKE